VGSVDDVSGVDEHDVLLDGDLLVLHLGGNVLLLEEVGHLDVDAGRACGHDHFDVGGLAELAVRLQHVVLDQLGYHAEVAVREDAAVHRPELGLEFLPAGLLGDFALLVLAHGVREVGSGLAAQLESLACQGVLDEHHFALGFNQFLSEVLNQFGIDVVYANKNALLVGVKVLQKLQ